MSLGGSRQSGNSSSAVDIPDFLEPFIRQSTGTAGRSLGVLENLLGLTGEAPLSDPITLNNVRGPGGGNVLYDPGQNGFVSGNGDFIAPFRDGVVPGLINGTDNPVQIFGDSVVGVGNTGQNELFTRPYLAPNSGAGGGVLSASSLVSPFTQEQEAAQQMGVDRVLAGDLFGSAQNAASDIAREGIGTSALDALPQFGQPEGMSDLRGLLGRGLSDTGTDALEATARGDYLLGGSGFDAAVDAAVRRATPGVLSTFGSAGAGGATGGLAQEAIGQAAIDAFASQYGAERNRQLGAAGDLNQYELADFGRRSDVASTLGGLDLAGSQQRLNQAQAQAGAGADDARARLVAAQMVPGLATADLDLLSRIGNVKQEFGQAQLDAPRNALLQLLTASLGGTPIESLLGRNTTAKQKGFSFSGGLDDITKMLGMAS